MAQKDYLLEFKLKAALDSSFAGAFGSANAQLGNMQQGLQDINRLQSDVSAYEKQQAAVDQTRQRLELYTTQLDNLKREQAETGNETAKLKNEIANKEYQVKRAEESLKTYQTRLDGTGERLRQSGVDTSKLAEETERLSAEYTELKTRQEGVADEQAKIPDWAKSMAGYVTAAAAGVKVTQELYKYMQYCVSVAAPFEQQMSTVQAIAGASAEEVQQLSALAKEMGAATKFTAYESAQAYEYMGMAGWSAAQMMAGLPGVMNLSAASGEDLALVTDIVTDAMTAFKMEASQASYFSDVLAKTATSANTNVAIMGETFKNVAPLAGAMGYNIEDMSVAIGLMANAGVKGSKSGTSLKNIITNLADPTDKVADAMATLGVTLTDETTGATLEFKEVVASLRTAFADLTPEQKASYAATIAGKQGMAGLLAIVNSTAEEYAELTASIAASSGAAEQMANTRLDNYLGQVTLLQSAWDGLATNIGSMFLPFMAQGASFASEVVSAINGALFGTAEVQSDIAQISEDIRNNLEISTLYSELQRLETQTKDQTLSEQELAAVEQQRVAIRKELAEVTGNTALAAYAADDALGSLFGNIGESNKLALLQNEMNWLDSQSEEVQKFIAAVRETEAMEKERLRLLGRSDDLNQLMKGLNDGNTAPVAFVDSYKESITAALQMTDFTQKREELVELAQMWETLTGDDMSGMIASAYNDSAATPQQYRMAGLTRFMSMIKDSDRLSEDMFTAASSENVNRIAELDDTLAQMNRTQEQYIERIVWGITKAEIDPDRIFGTVQAAFGGTEEGLELAAGVIDEVNARLVDMGFGAVVAAGDLAGLDAGLSVLTMTARGYAEQMEDAFASAYTVAHSSIYGQISLTNQMSDKLDKNSTTFKQMVSNLESQARVMENYETNLRTALEKGLDPSIVEHFFSSFSEENAKLMNALVKDATPENIDRFNSAYGKVLESTETLAGTMAGISTDFIADIAEMMKEAGDAGETGTLEMIGRMAAVITENGGMISDAEISAIVESLQMAQEETAEDAETTGAELVGGITKGVDDGAAALYAALRKAIMNAIAAGQDAADINSPSEETRSEIGLMLSYGMAEGVTDGAPELYAAMENITGTAIYAAQITAQTPSISVGRNLIQGIEKGVKNESGALQRAMRNTINAAIVAAEDAAGIHSPSEVARKRVGWMLPRGAALGVDDEAWRLETAMHNILNTTFEVDLPTVSAQAAVDVTTAISNSYNDGQRLASVMSDVLAPVFDVSVPPMVVTQAAGEVTAVPRDSDGDGQRLASAMRNVLAPAFDATIPPTVVTQATVEMIPSDSNDDGQRLASTLRDMLASVSDAAAPPMVVTQAAGEVTAIPSDNGGDGQHLASAMRDVLDPAFEVTEPPTVAMQAAVEVTTPTNVREGEDQSLASAMRDVLPPSFDAAVPPMVFMQAATEVTAVPSDKDDDGWRLASAMRDVLAPAFDATEPPTIVTPAAVEVIALPSAGEGGAVNITIENTVYISGSTSADITELLEQNNRKLAQRLEETLRDMRRQERRRTYG